MVLLDPRGRPPPSSCRCAAPTASSTTRSCEAHTRRRLERAPRKTTPAESEAEFYELHATLLAGWPAGTFQRKGQPFEYSPPTPRAPARLRRTSSSRCGASRMSAQIFCRGPRAADRLRAPPARALPAAAGRRHHEGAPRGGRGAQRARAPPARGPRAARGGAYLWHWFCELAAASKYDQPVGYAELDAWVRLTGARPTPREVATLRALDGAWRDKPALLDEDPAAWG
jgi:hypothetical protein